MPAWGQPRRLSQLIQFSFLSEQATLPLPRLPVSRPAGNFPKRRLPTGGWRVTVWAIAEPGWPIETGTGRRDRARSRRRSSV